MTWTYQQIGDAVQWIGPDALVLILSPDGATWTVRVRERDALGWATTLEESHGTRREALIEARRAVREISLGIA